HRNKTDMSFWARIRNQAVPDERGSILHSFITIEDISKQKEQERQLRVLSLIAEDNINAVIIANAKGRIEWVNRSFTEMTGYSLEEAAGKKTGQLLQGPDTDPETIAYLSHQIRTGRPFNCEILNYSKSGDKYWLRVNGQAIRNKEGEITGYFALEEDINYEKLAKERLTESENRLSALISNMQSGILLEDENRKIVFVNEKFCKMFGLRAAPEKLIGMDGSVLIGEGKRLFKDPDEYMEKTNKIVSGKRTVMAEELALSDDRFYSRDFVQIFVDGQFKGHLWNLSDISTRKNYEKNLRIQEAKYRNIIANMNLGLLEVDKNDMIEYANQSFSDISGYSMDQLIGKKASEVFLSSNHEKNRIKSKNKIREHGIADFYQMQIKNASGDLRWWLISGAPNYNDHGELTGSIGIHLDITDQKELERELGLAKQKAEEASQAKESFLANMSHEIRTPLNAIIGMVRELSREELTSKQNSYLKNASSASQHLLSIINNILDLSKIEAGEFHLEERHFEMRKLIHETGNIMSANAAEKLLEIEVSISPDMQPVYVGDPTRIRQILINLIGNSIKFTERGTIKVSCRGEDINDASQVVKLSVEDTGIGMDRSFSENVFRKFSQEDKSTARKYGGTGLGMALTYELVQLMNGSIDILSEKGIGTRVEISLTLPVGDEKMLKTIDHKNEFGNLKNKKILLVEDNEFNRLVATNTLAIQGILVDEAKNGEEAIKLLETKRFDLILMDLQMPVMDGLTATRIIRNEMDIRIPIIAFTADAVKKEIELCLSSGMNDFVTKPFEENVLLYKISVCLEDRPIGPSAISKTPKHDRFTPSDEKLYDLSKLVDVSRSGNDFVKKMIDVFLSNTPSAVKRIKEAFDAGDFKTVKKTAHRIKPSVIHLRIDSIVDDIRFIECFSTENQDIAKLSDAIGKVDHTIELVVDKLKKEAIYKAE
ncbi:MAG: PAS domain S-box protein, partial [Cytophagales bacterium]|nr:PAS domain S-box protein [Cytophagales bacterium]